MMSYDQDLDLYIPEGQSISPFRGLPTPPTENQSDPPTHKTLTSLDSLPPTHKSLTALDSVGVPQTVIGPKRRTRRGASQRTPQQQARSVARRNARERKRVRLVNLGFATLRDHIPPHLGLSAAPETPPQPKSSKGSSSSSNKKLSKVETLRCAIEYIRQLRDAVGYDDKDDFSSSYEMKDGSGGSIEGETSSSFTSDSPSPVMMLDSPSLFDDDENDDFFNIVDWTTL